MNPMQLAAQILQMNPTIQENPIGQQFAQILQSGNQKAGEELANNIINSYGLSKDQAIQQASQGLRQRGFKI